jgi:chromosomal replication initiation ATPase DnaA
MEQHEDTIGTSARAHLSSATETETIHAVAQQQTAKHLVSAWLGTVNAKGMDSLLALLSEMSGLTPSLILNGKNRTPREVKARQLFWACLREYGSMSYPEIGAIVDRSHTTIMHGVAQVPREVVESIAPMLKKLDIDALTM